MQYLKTDVRNRILEAAEKEFQQNGYLNASIRIIAENAGISFLPDYVTEDAVRRGTVKRLLVEDFDVELWKQILYRRDKWVSLQMKAIIKHLGEISLG